MGLSNATSRTLEKVGQFQNRRPPVPQAPPFTGHTMDRARGQGAGGGVKAGGGVLDTVGKAMAKAIDMEKQFTGTMPAIPYFGSPAATAWDQINGFKHAHDHWPNTCTVPPMQMPTDGPIIPLPVVSCADRTKICKLPAARCGDLGLSVWCGSYLPLNEIFLGSQTVWIESARAARALDMTKQCILSGPKPKDIPLGLPIGVITSGKFKVLIGGAPMPSLVAMAIGAAFKLAARALRPLTRAAMSVGRRAARAAFQSASRYFRKVFSAEARALNRFLKYAKIGGDATYKRGVVKDFERMAETEIGRARMKSLVDEGKPFRVMPKEQQLIDHPPQPKDAGKPIGPCAWPDKDCRFKKVDAPGNSVGDVYRDEAGNPQYFAPKKIVGPGEGSGSTVYYNPGETVNGAPSDVVAFHEMDHADHFAKGENAAGMGWNNKQMNDRWGNMEEFRTVGNENIYRQQRGGVPQRDRY